MTTFMLAGLDPRRPDHYLACCGLTWLTEGTLRFDGFTPILAINADEDPESVARRVVERARDLMVGRPGRNPEVPSFLSHPKTLIDVGTGQLAEEFRQYMSAAWREDGIDWSILAAVPNQTSGSHRWRAHVLTFEDRLGQTGFQHAWDSGEARLYADTESKVDGCGHGGLLSFYARQVEDLLLGNPRSTVQIRDKTIGRFSFDTPDASSVKDGSGKKQVDAAVELLALSSYPIFMPWETSGDSSLRWHLNTSPATPDGLAALQRVPFIPGLITVVAPILLVGNSAGYHKFDFQNTRFADQKENPR